MDTITLCLILIPALPLAAAIIIALFGARVLGEASHWPVVIAIGGSFLCSLLLIREITTEQGKLPEGSTGYEKVVTLWTWANVPNAYDLKPTVPVPASAPAIAGQPTPSDAGWKDFRIDVTLRADGLTSMMLSMVTFVATLVAIFGAGYMHGDRGYWRFFAFVGLFVFSMTMLVSVSNFILLFVFWEAVGVCSYLLIGFWYQKPEAAAAGMKAFLVNRVGDFGFALALFLIWITYGTLNYHDSLRDGTTDPAKIAKVLAMSDRELVDSFEDPKAVTNKTLVRGVLGQIRLQDGLYVGGSIATAICLLLLVGACGKSAQFPLHVWLPDAMEGPTPVSALIHAATMVTAGVYMVTRCTPLYMMSPTAQLVVACIGGLTALIAGLIALTQFDLKRVLAYSTVSQLGFMFLALGVGTFSGITAGMFHLFTHAFFKALLFLGAGSVMHAMGNVIDMRQFSGLRKLMPYTHWTFLCGCLALAGIVPFAGFWSKDSILGAVHDKVHELEHLQHPHEHEHHPPESASDKAVNSPLAALSQTELARFAFIYNVLYYSALFTAFLTAFYTFRAFFMTFYGEEKIPPQAGHHAHESPPLMTGPLVVLAICAVLIGVVWLRDGAATNILANYIGTAPSLATGLVATTRPAHPEFHLSVAAISSIVALSGIMLALYLYLGTRTEVEYLRGLFELRGVERFTDPQWVLQLERVWWIGGPVRWLRSIGLGFVVSALGLVLGIVSLLLAIPLLVFQFISPYRLSQGKFYFDELFYGLIVWPLKVLGAVFYWIDRSIIDGLVNVFGWIPREMGSLMRALQMGLVQFYAAAMVLGVVILLAARMLWAG